jgi:hypothetical protein
MEIILQESGAQRFGARTTRDLHYDLQPSHSLIRTVHQRTTG